MSREQRQLFRCPRDRWRPRRPGGRGLRRGVRRPRRNRRRQSESRWSDLAGRSRRSEVGRSTKTPAAKWAHRLRVSGATVLCGFRVVDQPEERVLLAEGSSGFRELEYEKLVLATGARERFLPFPGWTLPNVMGAGGLQAMVKAGLPIRGKRIVVAGTGPLLLAVAAYLRKHGARDTADL